MYKIKQIFLLEHFYRYLSLIIIQLIFSSHVAFGSPILEKTPYIYISTSHGQAMGLMFGRDTLYIGYDGYVQKVKEEYGMADTVQELIEGQLSKDETLQLFSLIEKELEKTSSEISKDKEKKDVKKTGLHPVPDYYPPSTRFEMLMPIKKVFESFIDLEKDKHLMTVIDRFLNGVKLIENNATRFIRTHEIKDKSTIKQSHIQPRSATQEEATSSGVLNPRHFLGRLLIKDSM